MGGSKDDTHVDLSLGALKFQIYFKLMKDTLGHLGQGYALYSLNPTPSKLCHLGLLYFLILEL